MAGWTAPGSGGRSGGDGDRLLERQVDVERDLVAHEPAAGLESDVPVESPVLAIDLGSSVEAGATRTVHAGVEPEELDVEVDRPGDVLDGHVRGHDVVVTALRLDGFGHDADLGIGVSREEVIRAQVRVPRTEAGVDARGRDADLGVRGGRVVLVDLDRA